MISTLAALLAATVVTASPVKAQSPVAASLPVSKADQKLGCAIMFVGFDELIRSNPGLLATLGGDDGGAKAIAPMLKMMGVSSESLLNTAMAEAAAKGEKPSDTYRRAIAGVTATVMSTPVEKGKDVAEQRGMALFTTCMTAITD